MSENPEGGPEANDETDPNLEDAPEGDADKKEQEEVTPEGGGGEEVKEEEKGDGAAADVPPTGGNRKPLTFEDPLELDFLRKMPNEVTMASIPRMNELRSVWRSGMQEVESAFQELISKINTAFEGKLVEFDKVRD